MTFRVCPSCGDAWSDRDAFLSDPDLSPVGYQADFDNLADGFFLFLHRKASCGTSMAIRVAHFVDLHDGPVFETRETGSGDCPEYCLHEDRLEGCSVHCECAFVRSVLQMLRTWPKAARSAAQVVGRRREA